MHWLVLAGSLLAAFWGVTMLTQATVGVGIVAAALMGGVVARMLQAAYHQGRTERRMASARDITPPSDQ